MLTILCGEEEEEEVFDGLEDSREDGGGWGGEQDKQAVHQPARPHGTHQRGEELLPRLRETAGGRGEGLDGRLDLGRGVCY